MLMTELTNTKHVISKDVCVYEGVYAYRLVNVIMYDFLLHKTDNLNKSLI